MKKILLFGLLFSITQFCGIAQKSNAGTAEKPVKGDVKIFSSKNVPGSVTKNWETSAQQYIAEAEYFFKKFDHNYATANSKQKLSFATTGLITSTSPLQFDETSKVTTWNSSLSLIQINETSTAGLMPFTTSSLTGNNHLLFEYGNFNVEYLNDERGVRQNFIIKHRSAGNAQLKVVLNISGDLLPAVTKNKVLELSDKKNGKSILKYDDLKVWDANHKQLNASMEVIDNNKVALVVDDAAAVYPVTVDPLTHASEWESSSIGLLPGILTNLQLQVDAMYGYSVAGLGDVNGDGFDDVAIGAPGAIDIIAGPVTVVGAGAVFVYFGSNTGLAATPDRVLRATTPVTNALFGFSMAGGNVTGSIIPGAIKKDIIVGAPGDTYSTSVSGFPTTATVTAGKVYVFSGDDLTAGPASPFASVYLNGSGFFSRGVLGLLLSNVNINALFGFSLAATDDMNGDGLAEIVVGAPGYAGVNLLDVASGAAFVYYSGNIASNTATQLATPTLLGFPGLTNINGLLFGFSVDGAGDYNKDSKPDIIIGAPGGLNLGASGFLGGSAYIYNGNGAGVNPAVATQLSAGGSLLGSVANLFGYCVKGVRDPSGNRNGHILVGAPVGSVLSNALPGLRLKAGNIHLFHAKLSPAATEIPVQSFSSPRSASLLSILNLQNINVNAMFGASIDNMMDVNCDGFADIIVGEPLSSAVGLVGVNAVGGAAYVFLGNPGNTYTTAPYWTLENETDYDFGLNAASLIGYSVAGGGHVSGSNKSVKALIGAPGKALDFSSGLFNLGNTFGTLFSFAAGGNGVGKGEQYTFVNCTLLAEDIISFSATAAACDAALKWALSNTDNLAYTEIQFSTDGINFTTVDKILPSSAPYNIRLAQQVKLAYYRLKVYNKNNEYHLSNIASVKTVCGTNDNKLSVVPTIFNSAVTVVFATAEQKGTAALQLQDMYGRTLMNSMITIGTGINRVTVNTNALPAGVYYISLKGKNWASETVKVVKQ